MPHTREITDPLDQDPRVLEAFLCLAGRLRGGEAVDERAILREYPAVADPLIEVLPGLVAAAGFARRNRADDVESSVARLGDYEISRLLGRGGMGIVYEGRHVLLGRRVAIKVLPRLSALDPAARRRFLREAESAAALDHPNIVPIYEVQVESATPYFVMKCVDGASLAELVRAIATYPAPAGPPGDAQAALIAGLAEGLLADGASLDADAAGGRGGRPRLFDPRHEDPEPRVGADAGPPPQRMVLGNPAYVRAVTRLGIQAADALQHAHENGVIHRDVKPANFLLDPAGQLWLTDFGLAWADRGGGTGLSAPAGGTFAYMSPEQRSPARVPIDHRTDVYSLGVTLHELLTLRHPLGEREWEVGGAAAGPPRPALVDARKANTAVTRDLATILHRAVATEAGDRFATAGELAAQLRLFLEGRPLTIGPPSAWSRASKWIYRHRRAFAAWSLILILILGATTALLFAEHRRGSASRASIRAALARMSRRVEDLASSAPKDYETARAACESTLQLLEDAVSGDPLARADPDFRYRLASLSFNHARLLTQFRKEEHGGAILASYDRSIEILRQLVCDHPTHRNHAWFRHDLARAVGNRGVALLDRGGPEALRLKIQAYEESVAIAGSLSLDFPGNLDWANVLANHQTNLAESYIQAGRLEDGLRVCLEAERTALIVVSLRPGDARYLRSVGSVLMMRGEALKRGGKSAEAEPVVGRSLAIAREVSRMAPDDPTLRCEVADRQASLADVLCGLGRDGEAEPVQLEAYLAAEGLARDYPSNDALIAARWPRLSRLARIRHALGRTRQAEADYRRAIGGLEDLHLRHPELARHELALLYRTCAAEHLRDPERARSLERSEAAIGPPRKSAVPDSKR